MCCGQGRAALAAAAEPAANLYVPPAPPPPAPPQAAAPSDAAPRGATTVRVRYAHQARVRVNGPVTGRAYEFSGTTPVQSVDSRDAEGLAATGFFRRVY